MRSLDPRSSHVTGTVTDLNCRSRFGSCGVQSTFLLKLSLGYRLTADPAFIECFYRLSPAFLFALNQNFEKFYLDDFNFAFVTSSSTNTFVANSLFNCHHNLPLHGILSPQPSLDFSAFLTIIILVVLEDLPPA